MNKLNKLCLGVLMACSLTACDDLIDPAIENFKDIDMMQKEPDFAKGFMVTAYRTLPGYYDNSDVATDDAVTNSKDNIFLKIATGSWTSETNPFNQWTSDYSAIQYLNIFLENAHDIKYKQNEVINKLLNERLHGEAYALRAIHHYFLLRAHSGYTADGNLAGVLLLDKFMGANADFNQPRASFKQSVDMIKKDLNAAEELLPDDYADVDNNHIPAKYDYVTLSGDYNLVMGNNARGLVNANIVRAFRSRLLLLAASPAYQNESNDVSWEQAADATAQLLDKIGGVAGLAANGVTYYCNTDEIAAIKEGSNPAEILWRENLATNNADQESNNYPPSLFGKGFINPTQNLVDAFPMANGYPINDARSHYDKNNPYVGRDPRLAKYIIYNGATEGPQNNVILTGSKLNTDDGINVKETSTRTGYYMKKRLIMNVNCNPASTSKATHLIPRLRFTEFFLNYAEAANEAWGPKGKGTHEYSAYDVIKAIRQRAGITDTEYLDECALDKDKMRELIRNERRLELCFESFRFWDLRRWKAPITETARGIDWGTETFTPLDNVEARKYEDYMYYGPIPHSEVLKYSNIQQNKGWK
jgi:hypothetical protein